MTAKCPSCDSSLITLTVTCLPSNQVQGKAFKCYVCSCPACGCAISAAIEPAAAKSDAIKIVASQGH